jgi:hypothetical protein
MRVANKQPRLCSDPTNVARRIQLFQACNCLALSPCLLTLSQSPTFAAIGLKCMHVLLAALMALEALELHGLHLAYRPVIYLFPAARASMQSVSLSTGLGGGLGRQVYQQTRRWPRHRESIECGDFLFIS